MGTSALAPPGAGSLTNTPSQGEERERLRNATHRDGKAHNLPESNDLMETWKMLFLWDKMLRSGHPLGITAGSVSSMIS